MTTLESIVAKFKKTVRNRFIKCVKEYELIQKNDRIAVCISGARIPYSCSRQTPNMSFHKVSAFRTEHPVPGGLCGHARQKKRA